MDGPRVADLRELHALAVTCAAAPDLTTFAQFVPAAVRALAPGSAATYRVIDLAGTSTPTVVVDPADAWVPGSTEAVAAFAYRDPLADRHLEARDSEALRTSDDTDPHRFMRPGRSDLVFRHVEADHQVAFSIRSQGTTLVGIAVNRAGSDFTDREIELLRFAQPLLAALWERAALLTMLTVATARGSRSATTRGSTRTRCSACRCGARDGHRRVAWPDDP